MRLIDISEWSKFFHKKLDNILPESIHDSGYRHAMQDVDAWIAEHTIEAEPARHGRWIGEKCNHKPYRIKNPEKWVTYKCSVCGYSNGRKQSNYCPNCGAKMDGGGVE